ncbi:PTS system transporter subunit IID [Amylolactobacillus amylotrophicus DSM 20534]|uniref:PTS system transporter subunit IID n=3 Tax=Amylolactobacillus TaxID=2767876 RepID=A0A0R1YH42_9LACO|nr:MULTISPECIES: PTS system mannose/fructose/sorbose family transporter subunit IID [Amylolactobacillus]APT18693.1 PTS mannose transporter subunit IID [Amylolactobacillus amylophilus DSM 20533 = JCM 1125]KRK37742.1 PTS system transporter subunit IID [Amylolactobacillus amylotrophicus DSM 20534]KRM41530.1 PTS system transporter subunit IID [Amylolactobacillus amylophilus DSM 20533 = JCM 1125]GED80759.1 PTS mannose transporter subunit IID [Amylolactobacillus amylophilus]
MTEKNNNVEFNHITKKDKKSIFIRSYLGLQLGWNYERMQGLGYAYSVMPALKRLYKDDPDKMKQALTLETGFFNTTPQMAHLIIGADVALQDQLGMNDQSEKAIAGLKTGLMGPFAGVGDTIFVAIYNAIIFSITAYMAMSNQPLGLLIPIIGCAVIAYVRWRLFGFGLEQGQKLASAFGNRMAIFTEGASILGLTVVGAMIPAVINYSVDITYKVGKVTMSVQEMLDKILPALIPLSIALFSYWILGRKRMNSTRLIFVLILLGMLLGNLQAIATWIGSIA